MARLSGNRAFATALLGMVVFDLVMFATGLPFRYDLAWLPPLLANLVMAEVAIVVAFMPQGRNAYLFGASLATGALYADVLAAILGVAGVLLRPNPFMCAAFFCVLAYFVWTGQASYDRASGRINARQEVSSAERAVMQQLLARMNALIVGERDLSRRQVLSWANDALRSCPTASRADVAAYEDAIAASVTRLEQLEQAGAAVDALRAEASELRGACAARNARLKVR